MAARIFISYRRSDTQMAAGRLYDALVARYGSASVFRDKEAIRPGYDWAEEIQNALAGNVVVLALLGPAWADARDADGRRRLDDPRDPNRLELEIALEKKVPLIPVLVEAATIPEELPPSLQPLIRRHAVRLRDDDWDGDFVRLTEALESLGLKASASARPSGVRQGRSSGAAMWLAAAVLVLSALTGAAVYMNSSQAGALPRSTPQSNSAADYVKANAPATDVKQPVEERQAPRPSAPRSNAAKSIPPESNAPAAQTRPVTTVPRFPTLAGTWRDETYPNVIDEIHQDGQRFRFVRTGRLPNGVLFESAGEGSIDGTRVSHRYAARYEGGGFSSGGCSGNLTSDGTRIVLQCSDSLLGQFPVVMVRR